MYKVKASDTPSIRHQVNKLIPFKSMWLLHACIFRPWLFPNRSARRNRNRKKHAFKWAITNLFHIVIPSRWLSVLIEIYLLRRVYISAHSLPLCGRFLAERIGDHRSPGFCAGVGMGGIAWSVYTIVETLTDDLAVLDGQVNRHYSNWWCSSSTYPRLAMYQIVFIYWYSWRLLWVYHFSQYAGMACHFHTWKGALCCKRL